MGKADSQVAVSDDFAQGGGDGKGGTGSSIGAIGGGSSSEGNVKVALDELEIGGEVAQEGVDGGRGEIAETQDLGDFAGS